MRESTEAEAEDDLETLEEEVFGWLLSKPAIVSAVDLACCGRYDEAGPAFDLELKELLRRADSSPVLPAASGEAGGCEAAAKRPLETRQPAAAGASPAAAAAEEPPAKRPCVADAPAAEASGAAAQRSDEAASKADPPGEWLENSKRRLEAEAERSAAKAAEGRGGGEEEREMERVPLYWKVDLPEVSKLLAKRGKLPPSHTPVDHPHVTLLYLGGCTEDSQAAAQANLPLNQFLEAKAALEALNGKMVEVQLTEVVIEECVTCAKVSLPPSVPCANEVPHVTLGTKRVPARYANQVLDELRSGRREGVTTVPLPSPRPLKGRVALELGSRAELRA